MLDIHVGVRRDELKPFKRILDKQFPKMLFFSTMEDRWEDWGATWSDENADDDDIIHIIISTMGPMMLIQFLVKVMMVFLNDITDDASGFFGKLVIVTDHTVWSSFYHELSFPE